MAGRLRTQRKALNDLGWTVHELCEKLWDTAPPDVFNTENFLKWLGGEPLDEKVELWNDARNGLGECEDALERRIAKLPTYRPPTIVPAAPAAPDETQSSQTVPEEGGLGTA